MANIMNGVSVVRVIVDELNRICKEEGGIRRNDPRIWDILHNLTEATWDDIVATVEAVNQDTVGICYPNDIAVIQDTRKALDKARALGKSFVGKPLVAKSGNKYLVWRFTMIMREVINRYNGINIKNQPGEIEDIKDLPADPFNSGVFES